MAVRAAPGALFNAGNKYAKFRPTYPPRLYHAIERYNPAARPPKGARTSRYIQCSLYSVYGCSTLRGFGSHISSSPSSSFPPPITMLLRHLCAKRLSLRYAFKVCADCSDTAGSGSLAVDVGTGTGQVAQELSTHYDRVIGLDLSASMLANAVQLRTLDCKRHNVLIIAGSKCGISRQRSGEDGRHHGSQCRSRGGRSGRTVRGLCNRRSRVS